MARASSSLHHTVLYCCLCCKYKVLQLKQIKRTEKHHCLKTVLACHSRYLIHLRKGQWHSSMCPETVQNDLFPLFCWQRSCFSHTFQHSKLWRVYQLATFTFDSRKKRARHIWTCWRSWEPEIWSMLGVHSPFTAPPSCSLKGLTHFLTAIGALGNTCAVEEVEWVVVHACVLNVLVVSVDGTEAPGFSRNIINQSKEITCW